MNTCYHGSLICPPQASPSDRTSSHSFDKTVSNSTARSWDKREAPKGRDIFVSVQGGSAGISARALREEDLGKKIGAFC